MVETEAMKCPAEAGHFFLFVAKPIGTLGRWPMGQGSLSCILLAGWQEADRNGVWP